MNGLSSDCAVHDWMDCLLLAKFSVDRSRGVIDESQDENKPITVCALWVLFQLVSVSDPS